MKYFIFAIFFCPAEKRLLLSFSTANKSDENTKHKIKADSCVEYIHYIKFLFISVTLSTFTSQMQTKVHLLSAWSSRMNQSSSVRLCCQWFLSLFTFHYNDCSIKGCQWQRQHLKPLNVFLLFFRQRRHGLPTAWKWKGTNKKIKNMRCPENYIRHSEGCFCCFSTPCK